MVAGSSLLAATFSLVARVGHPIGHINPRPCRKPRRKTMSNTSSPLTAGIYAKRFALYRAVVAAGFGLGAMKTMSARDGVAWSATLLIGKKVVIEASNGGFGGPDEVDVPFGKTAELTAAAREQAKQARTTLMALPEVQQFLQDFEISVISYGKKPKEEFEAEVAKIRASTLADTDERMGNLIATLAETKKLVAKAKRDASTKLVWAEKGHDFGTSTSVKVADTPANREMAMKKRPQSFEGFQGFLVDLVRDL
jgi:hypothetical protein